LSWAELTEAEEEAEADDTGVTAVPLEAWEGQASSEQLSEWLGVTPAPDVLVALVPPATEVRVVAEYALVGRIRSPSPNGEDPSLTHGLLLSLPLALLDSPDAGGRRGSRATEPSVSVSLRLEVPWAVQRMHSPSHGAQVTVVKDSTTDDLGTRTMYQVELQEVARSSRALELLVECDPRPVAVVAGSTVALLGTAAPDACGTHPTTACEVTLILDVSPAMQAHAHLGKVVARSLLRQLDGVLVNVVALGGGRSLDIALSNSVPITESLRTELASFIDRTEPSLSEQEIDFDFVLSAIALQPPGIPDARKATILISSGTATFTPHLYDTLHQIVAETPPPVAHLAPLQMFVACVGPNRARAATEIARVGLGAMENVAAVAQADGAAARLVARLSALPLFTASSAALVSKGAVKKTKVRADETFASSLLFPGDFVVVYGSHEQPTASVEARQHLLAQSAVAIAKKPVVSKETAAASPCRIHGRVVAIQPALEHALRGLAAQARCIAAESAVLDDAECLRVVAAEAESADIAAPNRPLTYHEEGSGAFYHVTSCLSLALPHVADRQKPPSGSRSAEQAAGGAESSESRAVLSPSYLLSLRNAALAAVHGDDDDDSPLLSVLQEQEDELVRLRLSSGSTESIVRRRPKRERKSKKASKSPATSGKRSSGSSRPSSGRRRSSHHAVASTEVTLVDRTTPPPPESTPASTAAASTGDAAVAVAASIRPRKALSPEAAEFSPSFLTQQPPAVLAPALPVTSSSSLFPLTADMAASPALSTCLLGQQTQLSRFLASRDIRPVLDALAGWTALDARASALFVGCCLATAEGERADRAALCSALLVDLVKRRVLTADQVLAGAQAQYQSLVARARNAPLAPRRLGAALAASAYAALHLDSDEQSGGACDDASSGTASTGPNGELNPVARTLLWLLSESEVTARQTGLAAAAIASFLKATAQVGGGEEAAVGAWQAADAMSKRWLPDSTDVVAWFQANQLTYLESEEALRAFAAAEREPVRSQGTYHHHRRQSSGDGGRRKR
jgi:hypothetical protein